MPIMMNSLNIYGPNPQLPALNLATSFTPIFSLWFMIKPMPPFCSFLWPPRLPRIVQLSGNQSKRKWLCFLFHNSWLSFLFNLLYNAQLRLVQMALDRVVASFPWLGRHRFSALLGICLFIFIGQFPMTQNGGLTSFVEYECKQSVTQFHSPLGKLLLTQANYFQISLWISSVPWWLLLR